MFASKSKKLSLNKETVRALSGNEMQGVVGGLMSGASHGCTCTCKCETLVCSLVRKPAEFFGRVAF